MDPLSPDPFVLLRVVIVVRGLAVLVLVRLVPVVLADQVRDWLRRLHSAATMSSSEKLIVH